MYALIADEVVRIRHRDDIATLAATHPDWDGTIAVCPLPQGGQADVPAHFAYCEHAGLAARYRVDQRVAAGLRPGDPRVELFRTVNARQEPTHVLVDRAARDLFARWWPGSVSPTQLAGWRRALTPFVEAGPGRSWQLALVAGVFESLPPRVRTQFSVESVLSKIGANPAYVIPPCDPAEVAQLLNALGVTGMHPQQVEKFVIEMCCVPPDGWVFPGGWTKEGGRWGWVASRHPNPEVTAEWVLAARHDQLEQAARLKQAATHAGPDFSRIVDALFERGNLSGQVGSILHSLYTAGELGLAQQVIRRIDSGAHFDGQVPSLYVDSGLPPDQFEQAATTALGMSIRPFANTRTFKKNLSLHRWGNPESAVIERGWEALRGTPADVKDALPPDGLVAFTADLLLGTAPDRIGDVLDEFGPCPWFAEAALVAVRAGRTVTPELARYLAYTAPTEFEQITQLEALWPDDGSGLRAELTAMTATPATWPSALSMTASAPGAVHYTASANSSYPPHLSAFFAAAIGNGLADHVAAAARGDFGGGEVPDPAAAAAAAAAASAGSAQASGVSYAATGALMLGERAVVVESTWWELVDEELPAGAEPGKASGIEPAPERILEALRAWSLPPGSPSGAIAAAIAAAPVDEQPALVGAWSAHADAASVADALVDQPDLLRRITAGFGEVPDRAKALLVALSDSQDVDVDALQEPARYLHTYWDALPAATRRSVYRNIAYELFSHRSDVAPQDVAAVVVRAVRAGFEVNAHGWQQAGHACWQDVAKHTDVALRLLEQSAPSRTQKHWSDVVNDIVAHGDDTVARRLYELGWLDTSQLRHLRHKPEAVLRVAATMTPQERRDLLLSHSDAGHSSVLWPAIEPGDVSAADLRAFVVASSGYHADDVARWSFGRGTSEHQQFVRDLLLVRGSGARDLLGPGWGCYATLQRLGDGAPAGAVTAEDWHAEADRLPALPEHERLQRAAELAAVVAATGPDPGVAQRALRVAAENEQALIVRHCIERGVRPPGTVYLEDPAVAAGALEAGWDVVAASPHVRDLSAAVRAAAILRGERRDPGVPRSVRELRALTEAHPFPIRDSDVADLAGQPIRARHSSRNSSDEASTWEVRVIGDTATLRKNAAEMGNCTMRSYHDRLASGRGVMLAVGGRKDGQGRWRTRWNVWVDLTSAGWKLGEVNSQHNAGDVPEELRTELEQRIGRLNRSR